VYLLPGLAVGTYAVTISHQGFGTASFQDVLLEVGLTRVWNTQLRVSLPGEKVQVEASQPLEQTEVSGVITEQQIQEIPINGRNWATLLVLAPGAIDDGGGDQRTIRFAGRGRDDNNYMIDGVDATGIQEQEEQAQKSTTRLQISEDAVSEYRVSSSLYTAEYGLAPVARSTLKPRAEPTNITAPFMSISATMRWTRVHSLISTPSGIRCDHRSV
jgi:hypothetical protein